MDQLSFFDLNDRLEQISKIGDPLEVLNEIVDWSGFDGILLKAKVRNCSGSSTGCSRTRACSPGAAPSSTQRS